ncbi:hypothetical protein [Parabacteroides goldsteinii]|uniref:hypothetical protein n=1 Tax=Parabacteroides goldsteinii TaxID=328812 RepID=UPI0032B19012
MAREIIKSLGSNLVGYSSFIEDLFTGPGIRVERINKDFIEIRFKRFFPKKLLNEKIQKLEAKLKEDGRI